MSFLTVGVIINTRAQGTLIKPTVPEKIEAFIGSDITIICPVHKDIKKFKVTWYFNNISVFDKDTKLQISSSRFPSHRYLTIRNVTYNDEGWYFCEVTMDIPQLITDHSNGTELVICKYCYTVFGLCTKYMAVKGITAWIEVTVLCVAFVSIFKLKEV